MYSMEFKAEALQVLAQNNWSCGRTARELGGVTVRTLYRWRGELAGFARRRHVWLTPAQKRMVARRVGDGVDVRVVAAEYGVCVATVYNIRNESRAKGALAFMDVKKHTGTPGGDSAGPPDDMGAPGKRCKPTPPADDDMEVLRKRCEGLELDNAILTEVVRVLKKDPGVDPSLMGNREKTMVIGALRNRFSVSLLCGTLNISRSSYYYARAAARVGDRYARARERIRLVVRAHDRTFGSERVWLALRNGDDGGTPLRISEKVVRRIMREEGLGPVYNKRKRAYSSYRGEISAHPGNKVARRFHASAPNKLWLTDITQFTLAGYKCYLSVIVDCFDGKVVAHRLSKHPDARLANGTLLDAINSLRHKETPILHSDCGCHYRWPEWIGICEENGITRSMSRKACSPDNAACEGFFGRMKNEFFHHRTWAGTTFEAFSRKLAEYIRYYNTQRKKKSLGWKSPDEYRLSLGYAA